MLTVWKRESIIPRQRLNTASLSGWIETRAVKLQASSSTNSASIPVQSFGFIYASSSDSLLVLLWYLIAFLSISTIQTIRSNNRTLYTRILICIQSLCTTFSYSRHDLRYNMRFESESRSEPDCRRSNSFSAAFNFRKYEYCYEYCDCTSIVWQLGGRILRPLRVIQGAATMAWWPDSPDRRLFALNCEACEA
jgi:hypothetical protein